MQGRKISAKIALFVSAVEIASMFLLYFIMSRNITHVLQDKATDDMSVMAKDRAELIETYIAGCCTFLDNYSKTFEITNVLENQTPYTIKKAQEYTNKCAEEKSRIEGLYVAKWDTYTLAHINPDSVNKTFRDKNSAKALENQIRKNNKAFCTGIVMAPVTKKMVIPVYSQVLGSNGEPIGFSGAAFYTDELAEKLMNLKNKNTPESSYLLINASNNVFIFHSQKELVGTECSDPEILAIMNNYKSDVSADGKYIYSGDKIVASCHYIADRNWFFIIADKKADVFKTTKTVRTEFFSICVIIATITLALCILCVERLMMPISAINNAIERFKKNDFSQEDSISRYCSRNDEFGTIANAVKELQEVLQNQNKLFEEMFEVQTVGTIVTSAANSEIKLINRQALELYGFNPDKTKEKLSIQDVRDKFSKEELASIDKQLALAIKSKKGDEIVFESPIHYDNGKTGYLLTHAKRVTLSNDDCVVIYSVVDITAQKQLELNLQILSETDYLTSLCNRRSGECKIENALKEGLTGMFCLFDVNKFKFINDNFGHAVGDKVLVTISQLMKKCFRSFDILIRLGGDEFAVFAIGVQDKNDGKKVIERFMSNIENTDLEELKGHKISVSLGAVFISGDESFSSMYEKADSLMYACKEKGENASAFFES